MFTIYGHTFKNAVWAYGRHVVRITNQYPRRFRLVYLAGEPGSTIRVPSGDFRTLGGAVRRAHRTRN